MKTALIVEDVPESQEMLREVVETAFPGIRIHCAASLAGAGKCLTDDPPDLALIDLVLPDGDGTDIIVSISRLLPDCIIVVASLYGDDLHLFPALRAGAHGYLLKDHPLQFLVEQLQGISAGNPPLSPAIARRMLKHFHSEEGKATGSVATVSLTQREREVLIELSKGISVIDISNELGISRHTAGDHVKNIYRKLKISSRAEAALRARELGLI